MMYYVVNIINVLHFIFYFSSKYILDARSHIVENNDKNNNNNDETEMKGETEGVKDGRMYNNLLIIIARRRRRRVKNRVSGCARFYTSIAICIHIIIIRMCV